jgi:hypothetical protein
VIAVGSHLRTRNSRMSWCAAVTWPNAECLLHPTAPAQAADTLDVFADDLGVVTFVAVHAAFGDLITSLSLDCHDVSGKTATYVVDLTASATFKPLPQIPSASWPANSLLPALIDPMKYSAAQLISAGYGLRPDPSETPSAYKHWLQAVSQTTRRVLSPGHPTKIASNSTQTDPNWSGPVVPCTGIIGQRGCDKLQGSFMGTTVPSVAFDTNGGVGIWGGLGGASGDVALIQSGFQIQPNATNTAMIEFAWKEYWSGNGFGGPGYATEWNLNNVTPGDYIYSEAWACDSAGNVNSSGGYGCFWVYDYTAAWVVSCTTPFGTPCYSLTAINTFTGATAEAIIEKNWPNLSNTGTVDMSLSYLDSRGVWLDFANSRSTALYNIINGSGQILEQWSALNQTDVTMQWVRAN